MAVKTKGFIEGSLPEELLRLLLALASTWADVIDVNTFKMIPLKGAMTNEDYEYASYNPVSYDLANHFCEMIADYHTDTPHILDYKKYPGHEPSDDEVELLAEDAEKYSLANHLFWGLWGIISRCDP